MGLKPQEVKTALRRLPQVDSYFGNRYSFSPYRGCAHACAYCDGRAERYYVEGVFEEDIVVRTNLTARLEEELPRLRERGFILAGSGVTDPYQPEEASRKLMAGAAALLARSPHPVMVTTKNALVGRDRELWKQISETGGFVLLMTLAGINEEERRIFEPGASPVEERLRIFREFRAAGIPRGAMLMPLLPGIWDTPDSLNRLLDRLAGVEIDFVLPGPLTLRPGIQKETFLAVLSGERPDLLPLYGKLYREERASGAPLSAYSRELFRRLSRQLLEREIPFLMPHRLFHGRISRADEVHLLIRHLQELYAPRGIDTSPLRRAEEIYRKWLLPRRKEYNRRRSLPGDHLDAQVLEALSSCSPGGFLDNSRLESFLRKIIIDGAVLDYATLKFF